jgi:superfamily II DNA or RNA helicase
MPRIFDNIDLPLLPSLRDSLALSHQADFCVGYFNLRGWKVLDDLIDRLDGTPPRQCRLLVGMQRLPQDELRQAMSLLGTEEDLSNQTVIRLKRRLAEDFRSQLTIGAPTDADEAGLRRLSAQLKAGKVVVKLFLRHSLHAKLYLCYRADPNNPITGFLGSSNLTLSGLCHQGELNVDVLDHDATQKLAKWFDDRWRDRWCVDITKELIQVIDESWARPQTLPPYHIYIKMAYHLAEEARAGLSEFTIPADMRATLMEFQAAAVRIAARHLEKRGGVILGDVVGLGKTLMATALARVFQDPPRSLETLILCPKNLVGMWKDYQAKYRLLGEVFSITKVQKILPDLRRYRVVIIDESHNLRNRDGRRWQVIRDYLERNECKVILLSATPYNKAYLDLSSQLRLFQSPDKLVTVRPEAYLREECRGRVEEFTRIHQCPINCLAAFEKSTHPDDWRELMRLYMVRRTRSFVERNYAFTACPACATVLLPSQEACPSCGQAKVPEDRRFLVLEGGARFHFPKRKPKAVKFRLRQDAADDPYGRLYSERVVDTIKELHLPRYGLGNYLLPTPDAPPGAHEADVMDNLSRAGKRLIGFCRINLFKRLESSGHAFLLSLRRHILRNQIFLHALAQGLPLPIGTQDASMFETTTDDQDADPVLFSDEETEAPAPTEISAGNLAEFASAGASAYATLADDHRNKFEWLPASRFIDKLARDLEEDSQRLFSILELAGEWDPNQDFKLNELHKLLTRKHGKEKVLVFSQFADTVEYLAVQLRGRGIPALAGVTGDTEDPAAVARRFSPESNRARKEVPPASELRVLVTTDVLSEGQNLQDAAVIVNFDLPWAIIRLIQRAGRVDRIGQKAEEILCYSFWPADGIEAIIKLRTRVQQRLQENAEVVGTDEAFFEGEKHNSTLHDLFTERSGILDDGEDNEVDLASLAYQIWKNASDADPSLRKLIPELPGVVYSTKALADVPSAPAGSAAPAPVPGVMVYVRTADENDALVWVDEQGRTVTESQHDILRAAACDATTPAVPRLSGHHGLVESAVKAVQSEHRTTGGQLGKPTSARRRVYERLKALADVNKGTLFESKVLSRALDAIYEAPLTETARDMLNREMRAGIDDSRLAELVLALFEEDRLCVQHDDPEAREPRIICSLGVAPTPTVP